MSDKPVETNKVNNVSITFRNRDGYSIEFSTFSGRIYTNVYFKEDRQAKGRGAKLKSLTLNALDLYRITRILEQLTELPPETQKSLSVSERNKDSGKYEVTGALCFGKDDKQVCYVEMQFKDMGRSYNIRCDLMIFGTLSPTETDFSPAQATADGVATFVWTIKTLFPISMVAANYRLDFSKRDGGSSNSRSYNDSDGADTY